jgi:hypothetical protein
MTVELGTTFTDPYLDVPDIVFEVNAKVDDELWQAEIVVGPENSLGVMDLYEEAHILLFRTE